MLKEAVKHQALPKVAKLEALEGQWTAYALKIQVKPKSLALVSGVRTSSIDLETRSFKFLFQKDHLSNLSKEWADDSLFIGQKMH